MPDERFQNDEPVEMQYLSDVYDTASGITPNPFLELIIFCTISCDSSFLKAHHRSMAAADIFRAQLKLLNTLDANIERLQASYSVAQWKCHPIVHFTQMFANALTICLCGYLKTFAPAEKEGHDRFIARMKQRAIKAALDLLKLARYIAKLSYFKEMELATAKEELATLLLDMSSMNKIAQDHLMEL
ncbi:hypothetical protein PRZ48_005122 [Zasmidium cellare]|uniref:Uncharacterized protein n=1 Tax=Zasmidium cellare TaxID=395010 RepID=A0ABR0ESL8_ZASCE|nr:hypothetical protein PRZ48_005122 [Zasmidium cellare]